MEISSDRGTIAISPRIRRPASGNRIGTATWTKNAHPVLLKELRQVAATRTERRQPVKLAYFRVADDPLTGSKAHGHCRSPRILNNLSPWIMYIIQSSEMRYEPEHKTQTRDRIVRNAASKL